MVRSSPGQHCVLNVFFKQVSGMANDPVPNVRFNVSKAIERMIPSVQDSTLASNVKPMLQTMCEDPDADVKYYAAQALQQIA